jgi:iron complex outermembrane receptor protein
MKRYLTILCIIFVQSLVAQDTTHVLKNAFIYEQKKEIQFSDIQPVSQAILNNFQNTTLQQLLEMHSNVFVKNYGISTLSTISIRGSSAAQTQVNWHGVNINHAATGLTDFSTLAVSMFDHIDIQYSSSFKNTSLSGSVNLDDSKPEFKRDFKMKAALGYESLQNISVLASVLYSDQVVYNKTKIMVNHAQNRYSFYNEDKDERQSNTHAKSKQIGVMNDFAVNIRSKHVLSIYSWLQHTQREIPATTFEPFSAKEESISSFRNIFEFKPKGNDYYSTTSSLATLLDHYSYEDSTVHIQSKVFTLTLPYSQTFHLKLNRNNNFYFKLMGRSSFMLNQSNNNLHTIGFNSSFTRENILKRIAVKLFVQKEFSNIFSLPMVYSLSTNVKIKYGLDAYANLSSNYRMPTLNELYYNPGGNIDLKPEISRNIESGFNYTKTYHQHSLLLGTAFYKRKVDQWIAWYGNSILTPHNIQQVESKGFEMNLNYDVILKKYQKPVVGYDIILIGRKYPSYTTLKSSILYAYTLSTTQQSAIANDYSIGKQIPYVPRYQFKMSVGFQHKNIEMHLVQTYTGYRFVTTDESQYLKPYAISTLWAAYHYRYQALKGAINLRFNNILNKSYQSIVGRVMPGRNGNISFTFEIP